MLDLHTMKVVYEVIAKQRKAIADEEPRCFDRGIRLQVLDLLVFELGNQEDEAFSEMASDEVERFLKEKC